MTIFLKGTHSRYLLFNQYYAVCSSVTDLCTLLYDKDYNIQYLYVIFKSLYSKCS